jgi:hypothetical protein
VTDGPFPEAKEFLAGYWIVEVDRADRAFEIAAKASAAPGPGGKPLIVSEPELDHAPIQAPASDPPRFRHEPAADPEEAFFALGLHGVSIDSLIARTAEDTAVIDGVFVGS